MSISEFTFDRMNMSTSLREDCMKLRALIRGRVARAADPIAEADAIVQELAGLGHEPFPMDRSATWRLWTPDYMTPRMRRPSGLTLEVDASVGAEIVVKVGFRTKRGMEVAPA